MKEEEITERNKLICEFMGYKQIIIPIDKWKFSGSKKPFPDHEIIRYGSITNNKDWFEEKDLKYHSDWNWLMNVLEKIEQTWIGKFGEMNIKILSECSDLLVKPNGRLYECRIKNHNYPEVIKGVGQSYNSRIKAVWLAIIDFIKWYNTQTNNSSHQEE